MTNVSGMANDDLLTTSQVAEILGIDRRTVGWRVRNGRMTPSMTLPGNGNYLFSRLEIEKIDREPTGELHADNPDRYRSEGAA